MFKNSSKGFALAELMIVVAIIGILSGIAIPGYNRFQFKSKQTEAKANLAAIFTTMKAFQAENGAYTTRFDAIGFNVEGNMRYRLGFTADQPPPPTAMTQGTATCIVTATPGYPACDPSYIPGWTIGLEAVNVPGLPATAVSPNSFKVYALSQLNGATIDSWSIDDNHNLLNQ